MEQPQYIFCTGLFPLLSSVLFPSCLLSCQGRFEVVSVACAKLVRHSHFYLFNLLWSHFRVAAHEAFVPHTECEDERWQQSLVDSVTVFIQLDSAGPDVALEDSLLQERMSTHEITISQCQALVCVGQHTS